MQLNQMTKPNLKNFIGYEIAAILVMGQTA